MKKRPLVFLALAMFVVSLNAVATIGQKNLKQNRLSYEQKQLLRAKPLAKNTVINKLIVYKSKRQLHAYYNDTHLKTYLIALGFNPIGHKQFEGDGKTPEGIYYINERNPNSAYHKNLGISYLSQNDTAYTKAHGKSAGGLIKIHGVKNGLWSVVGDKHLLSDWTNGCIALSDYQMDELFELVAHNALIDIRL